jgi:hypothetical protein
VAPPVVRLTEWALHIAAALGGFIGEDCETFLSSVLSRAAGTYIVTIREDQAVHTDVSIQPGQIVVIEGDRDYGGGLTFRETPSVCDDDHLIVTGEVCETAAHVLGLNYANDAGTEWASGCLAMGGAAYFSPVEDGSTEDPTQGYICAWPRRWLSWGSGAFTVGESASLSLSYLQVLLSISRHNIMWHRLLCARYAAHFNQSGVGLERKLYRVGPNCETWPNNLTENPY